RTYFGFRLSISQRSELGAYTTADSRRLATSLEASEIRAVPPREGTAQPFAPLQRGIVDYIDQALIVRRALRVSGEVSQVAAGCENRGHTGNPGDFVGVLDTFQRFDHDNQHDVVIDSGAITAWYVAPHRRVKGLAATLAALAERRE